MGCEDFDAEQSSKTIQIIVSFVDPHSSPSLTEGKYDPQSPGNQDAHKPLVNADPYPPLYTHGDWSKLMAHIMPQGVVSIAAM